MSFSSFTTPADEREAAHRPVAPTRLRSVFTLGLMIVWLLLIVFGAIAMVNPPWLQRISDPGIQAEFRDCKHLGDDLFRQGNYRQAIANYQHALTIIPDEPTVLTNLGVSWFKLGYHKHGLDTLIKALDKSESEYNRGVICTNLSEIFEKQGNLDEAIRYMELAVASGTELNIKYGKLGTLYLAKDDLAGAEAAFEASLAHQLDLARTYRDMLYRAKDTFLDDEIHRPIIDELLSHNYSEEDLTRFDLATIQDQQVNNRTAAITHNYLGWIDIRHDRFEEAEVHFRESLRIWPDSRNQNAHKNLEILRQLKAAQEPAERDRQGG